MLSETPRSRSAGRLAQASRPGRTGGVFDGGNAERAFVSGATVSSAVAFSSSQLALAKKSLLALESVFSTEKLLGACSDSSSGVLSTVACSSGMPSAPSSPPRLLCRDIAAGASVGSTCAVGRASREAPR